MSDQTDILSTMARDGAPALVTRDKEMIPTVLLRAMLILALSALALTTYAVVTDRPLTGQPLAAPVSEERQIVLLSNGPDHVSVLTADGQVILENGAERSGFLVVIARAVARQRGQHGVALDAPLALRNHTNGRLSLTDPATGWSVELASFGAANRDAFGALLN